MNKNWFSAVQLAKSDLLPFKLDKIVQLVDAGELKAIIKGKGRGRKIHISLKAVEEYLDKNQKSY